MRHNGFHSETRLEEAERLIDRYPWATIISVVDGAPVASHYPVLREPDAEELTLVTHVGRPDEEIHGFAPDREVLVIVAGPHGYVSPSWYGPEGTPVPTWNFSAVHLHGRPQMLDAEDNLRVLTRLVEHFEREVEEPLLLDQEVGARIARGTVGLRIPITRWTAKVKMSQDKDPVSRQNVVERLGGDGPYAHPELAAEMRRALDLGPPAAR